MWADDCFIVRLCLRPLCIGGVGLRDYSWLKLRKVAKTPFSLWIGYFRDFLVHCEGFCMQGGACSQTNENQMLPSLPGMPRSLQPQRKASRWTLIVWSAACTSTPHQSFTDGHKLKVLCHLTICDFSNLMWLNGLFWNLSCDIIHRSLSVISPDDVNDDFRCYCDKRWNHYNIWISLIMLVFYVFKCASYSLITLKL